MNNLSEMIRCPSCKSPLKELNTTLICQFHGSYKIKSGIPMLIKKEFLSSHSMKQIDYFESELEEPTFANLTHLNPWKKRYLERFFENFPNVKDKKILDCGTGSGYMAIGLAQKGAMVISSDITLKNLIKLKKITKKLGLEKNISFVCCSAEELPFKNYSFDFFVANAVLEHVSNEKQAINELSRIIKKGAGAMIAAPLNYRFLYPFLIPLNFFYDRRLGHLRRYDEKSLKKKFTMLKLKKIYYTGHLLKVIKIITNLFFPIFNNTTIEKEDQKKESFKYGASNIIGFFTRK